MVDERCWRKALTVLLFLFPNLIGFLLFSLVPVLASLVLSLFKWDLLTPPVFVGLRIPAKSTTGSGSNRPLIPIEIDRSFRRNPTG